MDVERQKTFGWFIAIDLFLTGTGASLFIFSYAIHLFDLLESFPQIGFIIGPILVLFGSLLLFIDLGNKKSFYRLITNMSSWMTRGTWSIIAFIIFGFAYSLIAMYIPDVIKTTLLIIIGIFALVSAVMTIMYAGFLLYKAKRVPFWNNLILPVMFLFSSLYLGMALFMIINSTTTINPDENFQAIMIAELALIIIHAFTFGVFIKIAFRTGGAAAQSVHILFQNGSFILVVLFIGTAAPLGLLIYHIITMDSNLSTLIACILLLIGGVYLRRAILKSGIRLPVSRDQLVSKMKYEQLYGHQSQ